MIGAQGLSNAPHHYTSKKEDDVRAGQTADKRHFSRQGAVFPSHAPLGGARVDPVSISPAILENIFAARHRVVRQSSNILWKL